MENLGIGFELMVVGMCTVFLILLIVIQGGKLLIRVVNRIAPEEMVSARKSVKAPAQIDATVMSILQETVKQLTGGKGHLESARKL